MVTPAPSFACSAAAAMLILAFEVALASPPRIGLFKSQRDGLSDPAGVAFKADGSILITDPLRRSIRRLDPHLNPIAELPLAPRSATPARPAGIAVASDGRVYVADAAADCVRVFNVDDAPLAVIGRRGTGEGELCEPAGIALGPDRLFVADSGNNRIAVFTPDGRPLPSIGRYGLASGQLNRPQGVAVDPDGHVYVADTDNHRIQKFTADGIFVKSWGDFGYFPGLLSEPSDVACHVGRVYVADKLNHRIQVFSFNGDLDYEWGLHVFEPHEGRGKFHYPSAIAIAPHGLLSAVAEAFEDRVQLFSATTGPISDIPPLPPMEPGLSSHFGPPIATGGKLLVLTEPESRKVLIYDYTQPTPIQIHNFGAFGPRLGQFSRITALALDDPRDRLYVADVGNRRLCEFALTRRDGPIRMEPRMSRFVRAIDLADAELMKRAACQWPIEPAAMLIDPAGLKLLDRRNARLITLTRDLEFQAAWGHRGEKPGEFWQPSALAAAPGGEPLFVADGELGRVSAFSAAGEFLFALAAPPATDAPARPTGVAIDASGFVYVADAGAHRVLKYAPGGEFQKQWGSRGLDAGRFFKPGGLAITTDGRLYVVDYGNHRVQSFDGDGNYTGVFGARLYAQAAKRTAPATSAPHK